MERNPAGTRDDGAPDDEEGADSVHVDLLAEELEPVVAARSALVPRSLRDFLD